MGKLAQGPIAMRLLPEESIIGAISSKSNGKYCASGLLLVAFSLLHMSIFPSSMNRPPVFNVLKLASTQAPLRLLSTTSTPSLFVEASS